LLHYLLNNNSLVFVARAEVSHPGFNEALESATKGNNIINIKCNIHNSPIDDKHVKNKS